MENKYSDIWHNKPYYSLDAWCKNNLQHKCYKVALNAHMTCPNRDGSLDTRGCIFCSAGGSGDFAVSFIPYSTISEGSFTADHQFAFAEESSTDTRHVFALKSSAAESLEKQLQQGLKLVSSKLPKDLSFLDTPYVIAYFQAYTNTYAPVPYLKQVYKQALDSPLVCGISIATRPDCLPDEVLDLLIELKAQYPSKFIWVELGLQTIHKETAAYIRRGYELSCFEEAIEKLHAIDIPVIVHVILGLPGETPEEMRQTVMYLNTFPIFGIKLQLLHVLKGTDLAADYENGGFEVLTKENYLDILIDCLEHLSPEIVIHRVTGDGPKNLLIAPLWSCDKRGVLNSLHQEMKARGAYQGRRKSE